MDRLAKRLMKIAEDIDSESIGIVAYPGRLYGRNASKGLVAYSGADEVDYDDLSAVYGKIGYEVEEIVFEGDREVYSTGTESHCIDCSIYDVIHKVEKDYGCSVPLHYVKGPRSGIGYVSAVSVSGKLRIAIKLQILYVEGKKGAKEEEAVRGEDVDGVELGKAFEEAFGQSWR